MSKLKEVTYERAATMLTRAIDGSERLGLSDAADRYRSMSVDDYIAEKNLVIVNPAPPSKSTTRRISTMASNDTRSKQELAEENEELLGLLDDIWNLHVDLTDSSLKQDLLEASGETCEILNDFDSDRFPFDEDETDNEPELEDEAA